MKMNHDLIGYIFTKILMLIFGVIFLVPSAYKIFTYAYTNYQSSAVYGEVTREGCGSYVGCKPYVEYKDLEGNTHEIKSRINFHFFFAPKQGDRLKVLFLENDPSVAIVDSLLHYIAIPLAFFIIGVILIFSVFSKKMITRNPVNRCFGEEQ